MFDGLESFACSCGKQHSFCADVIIQPGAIDQLPQVLRQRGLGCGFILADKNTFAAAGEQVCAVLHESGIETQQYVFSQDFIEPDEASVGLAVMHWDPKCDVLIGVGAGVINDICKIVSNVTGKPYIIIATAPSMDGYASATSSMVMESLKISLPSRCPDVIIGDTDVLCRAPIKMMLSGLGDMLAKYVSICEWRISHIINDEYFCPQIAQMVRDCLQKCVDNAPGLLRRDPAAVNAVFEGLIVCGAAMNFAGVSRPASGVEHYMSHVWDMRGTQFGTAVESHGIQCAVATLIAIRLYRKLQAITPDRQKALDYVARFDKDSWNETLRSFLGKSAESMIALEEKERKYDPARHAKRLERILQKWDAILQVIDQELPDTQALEALFDRVGLPKSACDFGIDAQILPLTFQSAKDIRDKYVLPRLLWDLGILDEIEI